MHFKGKKKKNVLFKFKSGKRKETQSFNCQIIQLTMRTSTLQANNMWYVSWLWLLQSRQSCEIFWGEARWSWHPLIINSVNYHSINQLWPLLQDLPMLLEINTHFLAPRCVRLIVLTHRQRPKQYTFLKKNYEDVRKETMDKHQLILNLHLVGNKKKLALLCSCISRLLLSKIWTKRTLIIKNVLLPVWFQVILYLSGQNCLMQLLLAR